MAWLTDKNGNHFVSGEDLVVRVQCKDASDALVAPTSLTFDVYEAALSGTAYTLGSAEVEELATGDYQLRHLTAAAAIDDEAEVEVTMVSSGYTKKELGKARLLSSPSV